MERTENDSFSAYNPVTNFVFFIGVVVLAMFLNHPCFAACSFICSLVYFFSIKKNSGLKFFLGMLILVAVVAVINCIFNTRGETALFTAFGRPFTFEALAWGLVTGGILASVIIWFACYNAIMTSDKFIYVFGKAAPSVSMVLSMVLRLVPRYKEKSRAISDARKCIGLSGKNNTKKDKMTNASSNASALLSWALEGGVVTADSMRARGYGSGKRTTFAIYKFDKRNFCVCAVLIVLFVICVFCIINGEVKATFYPEIIVTKLGNTSCLIGLISYAVLMLVPSFLNIKETITWHVLKSKI